MLSNSYLILSPAKPTDIAAAIFTQRMTIPFVWALAVSSSASRFDVENDNYYFSTAVGDALAILDRGMAAWNYNTYFRDTLAPTGVFRSWLANYPSETELYLNITELLQKSPNLETDLEAMQTLGERVRIALDKIEEKDFTTFLHELRKLSFPFITIPITGDRRKDIEILSYEIRDTTSIEAEMALQLVGVDRDTSVLRRATESISLRTNLPEAGTGNLSADGLTQQHTEKVLTLFTNDLDEARRLMTDILQCTVLRDGTHRILLNAQGRNFLLVRINEPVE